MSVPKILQIRGPTLQRLRGMGTDNLYGIELEYEGLVPIIQSQTWQMVADHSLRGGVEFVSRPMTVEQVDNEVRTIVSNLATLDVSKRCGLHVHMNVNHLRLDQFHALCVLYSLLEPSIYLTYAQGRDDSNFAMPWFSSGHIPMLIKREFINIHKAGRLPVPLRQFGAVDKYVGCNLASVPRLGTLEMRQPYCTKDPDRIIQWVHFLDSMINYCKEVPSSDIMSQYRSDIMEFIRSFFGEEIVGKRLPKRHQARAVAHASILMGCPILEVADKDRYVELFNDWS